MWMESSEYHKRPVKWRTVYVDSGCNMTGRYKGRRKAGEIWQEPNGSWVTVFTAHMGEEAAMKGPEIIEDYIRSQK